MKKRNSFAGRRRLRRGPLIACVAAAALLAAFAGVALATGARIHRNIRYAKSWSQAARAASRHTPSQARQELSAIDAGKFPAGNFADYPIIRTPQKDPDVENILVLGVDQPQGGTGAPSRADSIMVLSVNRKTRTLKIASLLRDIKTYFPNTESYHKLNAAFAYGGAGLQIDVVNYAFKLDIQKYALVDFDGFSHIIDTAGGVTLRLTAKEARYVGAGKNAGVYLLDGRRALSYVRAREIDSEFRRTQRQRNVIAALYNRFKNTGLPTKLSMANACLDYFKTNIPTVELTGSLLQFEDKLSAIRQISVPDESDGLFTTETHPVWYWNLNWGGEIKRLHAFLYGS